MKKIQLLILSAICTSVCFAQFQRNDRLLAGQFNLNSGHEKNITGNTKISGLSAGFNVSVSRFSSNTRYNSIQLSYNHTMNKQDNSIGNVSRFTSNQVGLAFGHTILTPLASRFYLSLPFTGGFTVGKGQNKNNGVLSASSNTLAIGVSASMGFLYQTKKRWVFMANIISLGQLSHTQARIKSYNLAGQVTTETRSSQVSFTGGFSGTPFSNLAVGVGYLIR